MQTLREAPTGARRRGANDVAVATSAVRSREPPPPELVPRSRSSSAPRNSRRARSNLRSSTCGRRCAASAAAAALAAAELGTALAFTDRPPEGVSALNEDDRAAAGQRARARARASGHARDGRPGESRSLAALGGTRASGSMLIQTARRRRASVCTSQSSRCRRRPVDGRARARPGVDARSETVRCSPSRARCRARLQGAARRCSWPTRWTKRRRCSVSSSASPARRSLMAFAQASHFRAAAWWRRGALAEAEADAENALRFPSPSFALRRDARRDPPRAGRRRGRSRGLARRGLEEISGVGRSGAPLQTRARLPRLRVASIRRSRTSSAADGSRRPGNPYAGALAPGAATRRAAGPRARKRGRPARP